MKKQKPIQRTAEKDLKNIRKFLGNSIKDFSESIGISQKELIAIEEGKRKLTKSELSRICSVIMNTVVILVGDNRNDKIANFDDGKQSQIVSNRSIIIKALTNFVNLYNPVNKDKETTINNEEVKVTYVQNDEPIDPKRYRRTR